jgi:D-cysteine desulfhydrase
VVGVAVSPPTAVLRHLARRLAQKTAAAAGSSIAVGLRAAARIDVEGTWMGRGYGHPTPEGEAATEIARDAGLTLDATYTAKAFACALDHAARVDAGHVLYWHTLSTAPLEPLLGDAGATAPLPRALARLLR